MRKIESLSSSETDKSEEFWGDRETRAALTEAAFNALQFMQGELDEGFNELESSEGSGFFGDEGSSNGPNSINHDSEDYSDLADPKEEPIIDLEDYSDLADPK